MLIRRSSGIKSSEITDRDALLRRRDFMRAAAGLYSAGIVLSGKAHAGAKLPQG